MRLDHLLAGDTFDSLAGYLSPSDRTVARGQLTNERAAVAARITEALRRAYGVDPADPAVVSEELAPAEQYPTLDPALQLRPPVGTSLRAAAEGLADQLYSYRYPAHPDYPERVTPAERATVLRQVRRALAQPNGRLENVDVPARKALTKLAGPLRLGTMYAAHFVADVQSWVDLIERSRVELGVRVFTVAQARQWLDGPPGARRGLLAADADLVLLAVAAATNRVLLDGGHPAPGAEVGQLRPDWELVGVDLPDEGTWDKAVSRGAEMGLVAASGLRSVTAVSDLTDQVVALARRSTDGAGALVRALDAARRRLGLPPETDRARTARAALDLVMLVSRRRERAVAALTEAEIPSGAAALGTSLAQAAAVAEALDAVNWPLIETAFGLGNPHRSDAEAVRDRLVHALSSDELASALVPRLAVANAAATELVTRATRSSVERAGGPGAAVFPPEAPGAPPAVAAAGSGVTAVAPGIAAPPGVGAGASGAAGPSAGVPTAGAGEQPWSEEVAVASLVALRDRLRAELGLELTWRLTRPGDADR